MNTNKSNLGFIILVLSSASIAYCHKVNVFAYVEGEKIVVQAYSSDGSAIKNSQIQVFGSDGKKLFDGKTDKKGEVSFLIPARTDLKIVLDAGMGHRAETTIPASELPEVKKIENKPHIEREKRTTIVKSSPPGSELDEEMLKRVVEEVMDEKLRPLYQILAKQEKISLIEVIGGIGYIFGLMGIIMFFWRKKKGD